MFSCDDWKLLENISNLKEIEFSLKEFLRCRKTRNGWTCAEMKKTLFWN